MPPNTSFVLQQAIESHSLCTGCTCQHATGVDSLKVLPQL